MAMLLPRPENTGRSGGPRRDGAEERERPAMFFAFFGLIWD
ncbi:hypothetical protein [Streptomyces subrutilus]